MRPEINMRGGQDSNRIGKEAPVLEDQYDTLRLTRAARQAKIPPKYEATLPVTTETKRFI